MCNNKNRRVISFSLWGDKPEYTVGAIRNAKDALIFYPDFECWFYVHEESVPNNIIRELLLMPNVKVFLKKGNLQSCKPMMWRFEAIDHPEVELMLSRDTDTRFLLREKLAVEDWIDSNKPFHIMRDHPYHENKIMGGMFGTRKIETIGLWSSLFPLVNQYSHRDYDQDFLRDHIYPHIKEADCSVIHTSFNKYENHAIDFPIPYDNEYHFIGEYIYENEGRCEEHVKYLRSFFNFS